MELIRYTHHAEEVMREREIEPTWVERTLAEPEAPCVPNSLS